MVEDVAVEECIPADSLSEEVAIALRIDTLGNFVGWRFLDNTCEGVYRQDLDPITPWTRQVVERAIERMDGRWSPARRADGRAVGYVQWLRFRVPRQRIEQQVNPDPLLFMGEIPGENFFYWVTDRTGYRSDRFPTTGGRVYIRFYVEADGRVTIDEVLRSPDDRLTKRVIRAIRRSEGKWTPARSTACRNARPTRSGAISSTSPIDPGGRGGRSENRLPGRMLRTHCRHGKRLHQHG